MNTTSGGIAAQMIDIAQHLLAADESRESFKAAAHLTRAAAWQARAERDYATLRAIVALAAEQGGRENSAEDALVWQNAARSAAFGLPRQEGSRAIARLEAQRSEVR